MFQISVCNPDWMTNLVCRGVVQDFSLELSQQFLNFVSSMGIVMQEDDTITQHTRAFALDNLTMANDYLLFPKLKEDLFGTMFSSERDVKAVAEYCLNGQGVISAKPG
ncbi:hypothetical protein AVEN_116568-1 [Araneus ventricosus]|uniref:Uncharacterized protein n=1 Tax=Araneus ventricosus TaxID=182803 RepID=A0A4Y2NLL7_ARAVE|nr:hypothetical protein AVEN_116568-1 [Araneus ventricosus]